MRDTVKVVWYGAVLIGHFKGIFPKQGYVYQDTFLTTTFKAQSW